MGAKQVVVEGSSEEKKRRPLYIKWTLMDERGGTACMKGKIAKEEDLKSDWREVVQHKLICGSMCLTPYECKQLG